MARIAARDVIEGGPRRPQRTSVTAIVPVHNRVGLLRDTIEALFSQDMHESYDIVIVDNASDGGVRQYLREVVAGSPRPIRVVLLERDCGPAFARNVGVVLSEAHIIAFTDSDCIPSPTWLRTIMASFSEGVGVVQGRTVAPPWQRQPLFNHFIETNREDGSYSTSNVAYRREAVLTAGGFDGSCRYWEDVDLGWRVKRLGWRSTFADDALVYHQVLPMSAAAWLGHAFKFYNWPAKAARYPEFRRHLFLGVWVRPFHALLQAAVMGLVLAPRRKIALALCVPYAVTFLRQRRFTGRRPLLKYAAFLARDAVTLVALVAGSIRFRSPVL